MLQASGLGSSHPPSPGVQDSADDIPGVDQHSEALCSLHPFTTVHERDYNSPHPNGDPKMRNLRSDASSGVQDRTNYIPGVDQHSEAGAQERPLDPGSPRRSPRQFKVLLSKVNTHAESQRPL